MLEGCAKMKKISREQLGEVLLYLAPGSNFSFWPNDGRQKNWANANNSSEYVVIDGWCINWLSTNEVKCPTEDEVLNANREEAAKMAARRLKDARNHERAQDLNLVSTYKLLCQTRPTLEWEEYLDELEEASSVLCKLNKG